MDKWGHTQTKLSFFFHCLMQKLERPQSCSEYVTVLLFLLLMLLLYQHLDFENASILPSCTLSFSYYLCKQTCTSYAHYVSTCLWKSVFLCLFSSNSVFVPMCFLSFPNFLILNALSYLITIIYRLLYLTATLWL